MQKCIKKKKKKSEVWKVVDPVQHGHDISKIRNTCLHYLILTGSGAQILKCTASEEAQEEARGHKRRLGHHGLRRSKVEGEDGEEGKARGKPTQPAALQGRAPAVPGLLFLRSVSFCNVLLSPAWQSSEITPNVAAVPAD